MLRQLALRHQSFLWFAAVGIFSGAVYFICLYLLMEALAVDYRLAVTIAYSLSLICHFFANRQITFRGQSGAVHVHLMRYGVMIILNYLTTMAIVIAMVNYLLISAYVGAVVAIAFNMISNYSLSKYWVFNE